MYIHRYKGSNINKLLLIKIIMFNRMIKPMDNHRDSKVLKFLGEKKVITSSELAKFIGVSWNTAEKYLLELALEGKIIKIKKEGVNLWMLK